MCYVLRENSLFHDANGTPLPCQHVYVDGLIYHFRSVLLCQCEHPPCVANYNNLDQLIPHCPSWPAMQQWVKQFIACYLGTGASVGSNMPSVNQLV